ncbi:MAG TPA: polysaccharide deacetylase family protein [Pirellulales bacterium]|nr:polysaccharide deacetylase family protein [Pirellulales bacterium]
MNHRLALLNMYYRGTLPLRWWLNRRRAAQGSMPILTLFYHRIADDEANPWTTSNAVFAQHLEWLRHHFEIISLSEAQARIRANVNTGPAICITFDDGYASNCDTAIPLMIEHNIPCTYFVSLHYIANGLPFPHDVHRGVSFATNTLAQLRSMANEGIEIGCHTRTHPDIGAIQDPNRLFDEIVTAGEDLQQEIGRPVRYFAFPFGQKKNLSAAAFHLAYEAGYEGVCSAYGGYNLPGDDAFHLQRVHGDNEMIRLKNWATIDPRKFSIERYRYTQPVAEPAVAGVATT